MEPQIRIFGENYDDGTKPSYKPLIERSFDVDSYQQIALEQFLLDRNLLVLAHTGRGKTFVMEETIANVIKNIHDEKDNGVCVVAVPTRALARQLFKDLTVKFKSFSDTFGIDVTVGILTGGGVEIGTDGNIIIMTTEILKQIVQGIRKDKSETHKSLVTDFESKIKLVVFDEVHFFNDKDRGEAWEWSILMLDPKVKLVMLSATLSHPEKFASWVLSRKNKDISIISTDHRAVPLRSYVLIDDKKILVQDEHDIFYTPEWDRSIALHNKSKSQKKHLRRVDETRINDAVEYMKDNDLLQANFFVFSIEKCEQYAKDITTVLVEGKEGMDALNYFDDRLIKYKKDLEKTPQWHTIRDLIVKGIAFHHAGVIDVIKEAIEELFLAGMIKILFSTETFAVGINMPTRTVAFISLKKRTDNNLRLLFSHEFKQMAGRAGRRGYDTTGNVIIIPVHDLPSSIEINSMFTGKVPEITSQLNMTYSFLLQSAMSDKLTIEETLDSTLFSIQMSKAIKNDRSRIEKELGDIESIDHGFSNDELNIFKEYQSMIDTEIEMENNFMEFSNKEIKERIKKKSSLSSKVSEFDSKFHIYQSHIKKKLALNNELIKIKEWESSSVTKLSYLAAVLQELEYIDGSISSLSDLRSSKIYEKGVIASQINDCNPLLLTELIVDKCFNDLSPEEIFAVLSCFVAEKSKTEPLEASSITSNSELSCNIHDFVDIIESIKTKIQSIEKEWSIEAENNLSWEMSFDYVLPAYLWAKGYSYVSITDILPQKHEGKFINTILRTFDMVHDIACLSEIIGNIDILPKLEKIESLVIRDIVNVNSLYLDS